MVQNSCRAQESFPSNSKREKQHSLVLSIPKIPSLTSKGGYWISWTSSGSHPAPEPGLCRPSAFPKFPP